MLVKNMKPRKLYGDSILVNQIITGLTISNKFDNGSVEYFDSQTNERWLMYEVDSMYLGGQILNLIQIPEPTYSELIDISFSSDYDDEVVASTLRLRDNELNRGQEFREELLNEIIKIDINKLDKSQKERIKKIILFSELDHGENRREIIGKKLKEIETDSDFFMNIAMKVEKILKKL